MKYDEEKNQHDREEDPYNNDEEILSYDKEELKRGKMSFHIEIEAIHNFLMKDIK